MIIAYRINTAKIKWLALTHIRLPQLQPQYQKMLSYVQCNKITLLESQARLAFLGAWDRNGLVQSMRCYKIGEIGR